MRKLLIAGNWKMNLTTHEASLLVHRLNERIPIHQHLEVVLAPSMLYLQPLSLQIDRRKFRLAAQNASPKLTQGNGKLGSRLRRRRKSATDSDGAGLAVPQRVWDAARNTRGSSQRRNWQNRASICRSLE